VLGDALVAACIDFYGLLRVAEAPDKLVYVSPEKQTIFGPDPIGILKNPPHPELAQRFVDFVLSRRGQALWAVRRGCPDGPVQYDLMRQPIRRDVYTAYAKDLSPWIANPYQAGQEMHLDTGMLKIRFRVLCSLVKAAAIDNAAGLKKAKTKLIETHFDPARLAQFAALPENLRTPDQIRQASEAITQATSAEQLTTGWQRFFRDKYERVAAP
jgi:spermidine/putrescine-binding protein